MHKYKCILWKKNTFDNNSYKYPVICLIFSFSINDVSFIEAFKKNSISLFIFFED
jgi:hypothetical protein